LRLTAIHHKMKAVLPLLAIVLLAGISQCYGTLCDDGAAVDCFVEPCQVSNCDGVHEAKCIDDYCAGCKARWFVGETEVTEKCTVA
ncbi:unnamed protein product, partial [Candidula unifasciata]